MSCPKDDEGVLTTDLFSSEDWKTAFATADKEQAKVTAENLAIRTNAALYLPSLDSVTGEEGKKEGKLKRKERKDDHTSEVIRDQPNNVVAIVEITRVIAQKKATGSTTVATSWKKTMLQYV